MTQHVFIGLREACVTNPHVYGARDPYRSLHVYAIAGAPDCLQYNGQQEALAEMVSRQKLKPIAMRLDLANHSPTGLECGYEGSGAAQTALAIASIVFGDATALRVYQDLKRRAIAGLPRDRHWMLTEQEIRFSLADLIERTEP